MKTTQSNKEDGLHFFNQAYRNLLHLEHMYRTNQLQGNETLQQIRVCLDIINEQRKQFSDLKLEEWRTLDQS